MPRKPSPLSNYPAARIEQMLDAARTHHAMCVRKQEIATARTENAEKAIDALAAELARRERVSKDSEIL